MDFAQAHDGGAVVALNLRAGREGAKAVHAMVGLARVGPPARDEVADELDVLDSGHVGKRDA